MLLIPEKELLYRTEGNMCINQKHKEKKQTWLIKQY